MGLTASKALVMDVLDLVRLRDSVWPLVLTQQSVSPPAMAEALLLEFLRVPLQVWAMRQVRA